MNKAPRLVVVFPEPTDLERVARAAARMGLSLSAFVRMSSIEKARQTLGADWDRPTPPREE